MTVYAHILGETPVRLWGLSSRERLKRLLRQAKVTHLVEDLGSIPDKNSVLILRGDYLFDNRVIKDLVKCHNAILQVPAGKTRVTVAAHVPASRAMQARALLTETLPVDIMPDVRIETPDTLTASFDDSLLKSDPSFVEHIASENQKILEQRLFSSSYKGVTDLVTKWLWPAPAQWATRLCVRYGINPNQVTCLSLILVVLAGTLFAYGFYGWGLLMGWVMTFLDTVDGKLARVTVTSSQFGHVLDKSLDIIHPPLWYIAWGLSLEAFKPPVPELSLQLMLWLIVIGYIWGRAIEGVFQLWLGAFGIFCWRPIDSYFRLVTARRNPCLILLTAGLTLGRPDLGLVAVAFWTLLSSGLLFMRLTLALYVRTTSGSLRSWLADIDKGIYNGSMAARLFTGPATS